MYRIETIKNKRIGISVLNWGLGHVTRCVPIIHQLHAQSNEVFVFCNQDQKLIFDQYLEEITFIKHEGYPFSFKGKGNFKVDLFRSLIRLYTFAKREQKLCNQNVERYNLDLLISDQRFGFYSDKIPSIFITHQLKFPLKGAYRIFNLVNRLQISKFKGIWIMDNEENLAGDLSKNNFFKNTFQIGHHSRFDLLKTDHKKTIQSVLVVNGPSSYSEYLLSHFSKQLKNNQIQYIIGGPHVRKEMNCHNTEAVFIPNTDMEKADEVMGKAQEICGYFGYSTLMDCKALSCSFNLIPTPGQLEQIYLSKLHKKSP